MRLLFLSTLIFFSVNLSVAQTSLQEIALENGKYTVGFKHYTAFDSTRTYQRIYDWSNKHIPRPIPISIWYPASNNSKDTKPMKVIDYMEILKEEEEWENLPNEQILNWFYYPNTPANQDHLKEPTTAYSKIAPAKGTFPVILYAPSFHASSIENFALCEYLASNGYVIISSPSRGTENRWFEGATAKSMETQARDIEFLIKESHQLPNIDTENIATMGFSFGSLSNVLSQVRNDQIKAIVSLDGSIKYQYATLKKSPFFDIGKVDVPFIHMAQKDIPEQVLKEDNLNPELNTKFEFYDSLTYSNAYQLKFHHMTHSYFSTLGVLFQQRDPRQDKSDKEIMISYKWVSTYSLQFLDAYLKNDKKALNFVEVDPVEAGVKAGLISYSSKKSKGRAFTFEDFNELASKQNYDKLIDLYKYTLKENPSLQLPEWKLNNLGLQLVFNSKTSRQGIKVFLLATHIYPGSANLFDSLAEAYLHIGNKEKAKENFIKSLELDEQNQNAKNRLNQLVNSKNP